MVVGDDGTITNHTPTTAVTTGLDEICRPRRTFSFSVSQVKPLSSCYDYRSQSTITGYIGGTILDTILKHPKASQLAITTHVRSAENAKNGLGKRRENLREIGPEKGRARGMGAVLSGVCTYQEARLPPRHRPASGDTPA